MTTNIQLLRSSVVNKRPNPVTLLDGQAAVNLNVLAPGLFFKTSDGSLTKIGPAQVSTTGTPPNSAPAGASGNALGEQWLDARAVFNGPVMKSWDGSQWVTNNGFTLTDATGDFGFTKTLTVRTAIANGTGQYSYVQIPSGPTTDEAAIIPPASGMVRYDNTRQEFTGYFENAWKVIGKSGDAAFDNLIVYGNTTLGDDCTEDTLTVTAVSDFNCATTFGPDCNTTTTFNTSTVFNCAQNIMSRNDVRFFPGSATSGTYVAFEAPAAVASSVTWTLPSFDGSVGQLLRTDGAGNLSWATPSAFSFDSSLIPTQDDAFDIGSPAFRVRNFYTGDLHLRNDRGDWTMIEEEDYLSLRNNKTGKMFKIKMEEVS